MDLDLVSKSTLVTWFDIFLYTKALNEFKIIQNKQNRKTANERKKNLNR